MRLFITVLLFALAFRVFSQEKPAYTVFTGDGKKVDYGEMLKYVSRSDVIFFGELHDNPVAHWLEFEITRDLHSMKGNGLVLAAEMFETDNQLIIDEYLTGKIKETSFEAEARFWPNYKTDYKPLINYAKDNGLSFVASNIPRRYASSVASGGFEALNGFSSDALKYMAPLPVEYDPELPCYKDMLSMEGAIGGPMAKNMNENLPKAQAIKDATMAYSIARYWLPSKTLIHFNGSYHSERYMGIIWYLKKYTTGLSISTITTVLQDEIDKMNDESNGKADFVIVIPASMTRTYRSAVQ